MASKDPFSSKNMFSDCTFIEISFLDLSSTLTWIESNAPVYWIRYDCNMCPILAICPHLNESSTLGHMLQSQRNQCIGALDSIHSLRFNGLWQEKLLKRKIDVIEWYIYIYIYIYIQILFIKIYIYIDMIN